MLVAGTSTSWRTRRTSVAATTRTTPTDIASSASTSGTPTKYEDIKGFLTSFTHIFTQIERPFTNNPVIPLLDCVYDHVIKRYPKRSFCILRNCVRVSDLLRSTKVSLCQMRNILMNYSRTPFLSLFVRLAPLLANPVQPTH